MRGAPSHRMSNNRHGFPRRSSGVAPLAIAEVPLGVLAGAALGAFAGPVGVIAGAIGGSIVGAVLAVGHNRQMHLDAEEEERIDRELGVIGGDIGAPNLRHPPPSVGGLYHASSLGAASTRGGPNNVIAGGPINPPGE
jgi:hypothetical protein